MLAWHVWRYELGVPHFVGMFVVLLFIVALVVLLSGRSNN